MLNTHVSSKINLGCGHHKACNIGKLVGAYADVAANEYVLFFWALPYGKWNRRFSYVRLPLNLTIPHLGYIVAYGKWKHFWAVNDALPFTGEAIMKLVEDEITTKKRLPSAWRTRGSWQVNFPPTHEEQGLTLQTLLVDMDTRMVEPPGCAWAETFRHNFEAIGVKASKKASREAAHKMALQGWHKVHESLRLEVCDNPLVLVEEPYDDEFASPKYRPKFAVSFEYEGRKDEAYRLFEAKVDKLPTWRPPMSWVPEEPIPMVVQDLPTLTSVEKGKPAEVITTPVTKKSDREPTSLQKAKTIISPELISPSRDGMRSPVVPLAAGGGDGGAPLGDARSLPPPSRPVLTPKVIVQRVLERCRRREIENVCVQVDGPQQSFFHWSVRLDGELENFFLLWCWSSRAKTHDFLGRLADERLWAVIRGSPQQIFVVPVTMAGVIGGLVRPAGVPVEVLFVTEYEYVDDKVLVALEAEVVVSEPEDFKAPKLSRSVAEPVTSKRRRDDSEDGSRDPPRRERLSRSRSPASTIRSSIRSRPSSRHSSRDRRDSRDRRAAEPRGRSSERRMERESDDLFVEFTTRSTRTTSVSRTSKKLPTNYRKTATSAVWTKGSKQTFELFCREIWDEAQSYDRGMATFVDMVAARVQSHVRGSLGPLLTLRGRYQDPVTGFRIGDLSRTDPVSWLRAATPLADPDVTGERRMAGALKYRQKDDEPFYLYHQVLAQSMLIAGIHLGWGRRTLHRQVLAAFSDGLNTRCHVLLRKRFGSGRLETDRYDEIVRYLDRMDRIERDTRSKAAESYCHMIRDELQPGKVEADRKSVDASATAADKDGEDDKIPPGRRGLLRERKDLIAQLKTAEAEKKAALAAAAAAKATVATVATAKPTKGAKERKAPRTLVTCPHCPKPHAWSIERCFNNPACVVPEAERVVRRPKPAKSSITEIETTTASK